MWMVRFSRRLPPRLSLWRVMRPDEAWRGAVPLAVANLALGRVPGGVTDLGEYLSGAEGRDSPDGG